MSITKSALAWATVCTCLASPSVTRAEDPPAGSSEEEPSFEAVAEVEAPARETTKHEIEGDALREIAGTRGDPLRAIEVMPGVGRTGIGDGTPRLRGSAGFDSISLVDGAPVPLLYHFGGLTSVIQPRLVERVTLYPGNFPVTYGRATGGVVAADVRSPRYDGFHAMVDLGTVDTSALVEAPIGDSFAFAVAGRRSNIDLFFGAFAPKDAYEVVAAPVYCDYQALGEARFGPHVLRLFGYGSSDRIELLLSEPSAEEPALRGETGASIAFHRIQARLDTEIAEDVTQRVQLTYGVLDATQNIASTDASFFRHDVLGRATWDARISDAVGVRTGFDVEMSLLCAPSGTAPYRSRRGPRGPLSRAGTARSRRALRRLIPDDARRAGKSGEATVRARIGPTGAVAELRIERASDPAFGAACRSLLAPSRWSTPKDREGRAVSTWVKYTCRFHAER